MLKFIAVLATNFCRSESSTGENCFTVETTNDCSKLLDRFITSYQVYDTYCRLSTFKVESDRRVE